MSKAIFLACMFALLLLAATSSSERAAAGACYADWSQAAPIVREKGLTTVESLALLARERIAGAIVKTTLCEEGDGFVYRLLVRDRSGRLSNHTVDARAPFAGTTSQGAAPHVP
jgi:hypothetical protein